MQSLHVPAGGALSSAELARVGVRRTSKVQAIRGMGISFKKGYESSSRGGYDYFIRSSGRLKLFSRGAGSARGQLRGLLSRTKPRGEIDMVWPRMNSCDHSS